MGLKTDIYNALVTNLGKEHINNSPEGQKKVDVLANDLRDAIVKWIQAQTFNITEMEAPIHFPATTIKTQVGGGSTANQGAGGGYSGSYGDDAGVTIDVTTPEGQKKREEFRKRTGSTIITEA